MPTYQYACSKCTHEFDIFQSMSVPALEVCPKEKCPRKTWGKGKVKRVIGAGAGLIFKGSGFYITDYRSDNYKEAAKKDAAASSGSTEKAGASTETKAAAPTKVEPKKETSPSTKPSKR